MKFLKISLCFILLTIIIGSCTKTENEIFTGEFIQLPLTFNGEYLKQNDGQTVDLGVSVTLAGPQRSSPVSFSFEIVDSLSTAEENTHFTIDSNTGMIPANSTRGPLPIQIIDDNIGDGERLIIAVRLTSADVSLNPNYTLGEYSISVICGESELATEVFYENFDNFSGDTFTGEDELFLFDNKPGNYKVNDFSFGSWKGAYDFDEVPRGTLLFKENCGEISMGGTDQLGDVWEMTELVASGGPEFTFKYENTYGEFGTVTLTKKDGTNWPTLKLE